MGDNELLDTELPSDTPIDDSGNLNPDGTVASGARDDGLQEDRGDEQSKRRGLSEVTYAQALEACVAHAGLPRPAIAPADVRPWFRTGPRNIGGRITALAQDPTNPRLIYAGSAHGGLWRSVDGGDTWRNFGPPDFSLPVGAIAIPEGHPEILYVGTGSHRQDRVSGRGIFKVSIPSPLSQPGFGQLVGTDPPTTTPAAATPGAAYRFHAIAIDPEDPTVFWAASQTGLWRFTVPLAFVPAPGDVITKAPPGTGNPQLEFPPNPMPGAFPATAALSTGPIPLPGDFQSWPQYATDVTVCRHPTDATLKADGTQRFLLILVGVDAAGVFRAKYDRQTNSVVAPGWTLLNVPNPALATIGRVRLAQCRDLPLNVYAVFSTTNNVASAVYSSTDAGNNWTLGGPLPAPVNTGQADYDLVLAVNPSHPQFLICGVVDLAKSEDSGTTWTQIGDWTFYDVGDHAQHADQHVAMFDAGDRRRVWCGNDGGLQMTTNISEITGPAPLRFWRKRSHGLNATQIQSTAVNGSHAFMGGCGLQDNGSWWGLGGPTWYRVGWADGGGFAFHRGDPRRMYPSQNTSMNVGTVVAPVAPSFVQGPNALVSHALPELQTAALPATFVPGNMQVQIDSIGNFAAFSNVVNGIWPPFVPVVEEDPSSPGRILGGATHAPTRALRLQLAYVSGPFNPLPGLNPAPVALAYAAGVSAAIPEGSEGSAVAFGPVVGASADAWIGTSVGQVLVSTTGATGNFRLTTALPNPTGVVQYVAGIAVCPTDARIAAVTVLPNVQGVLLIIVAAGPVGTARFRFTFNALGTTPNPTRLFTAAATTAPTVLLPGSMFTVTFAGNFAVNDRWFFAPGTGLIAAATNSGAAVFNATPTVTTNATITVRITANGAVGAAQFSYQIGAAVAIPNNTVQTQFAIPGTLITVQFGAGQYNTPDAWTITPAATVAPLVAVPPITSTGIVNARNWFGGRVYLTFDKGGTWRDVTETFDGVNPATRSLPPGPVACLLFDPTPPAAANAPTRLFAGTLAGVYAMPNVPTVAPAAAAAVPVDWRPFNNRLPLALVTDMRAVPGSHRIRIGTYGRGFYEIDLDAVPAVPAGAGPTPPQRLFIRQTLIEDGRGYPRQIPFALRDDPRLPVGRVGIDFAHSYDIRIDASPFDFFDDRIDGVEFDEQLGIDLIQPRVRNNVYVQIHNSGRDDIENARVHLFFCASAAGAPIGPPGAAPAGPPAFVQPALPVGMNVGPIADFYLPAADFQPAAGAQWQRVGPPQPVPRVTPGDPIVVRFEWEDVPAALAGGNVALVALVDAPSDHTWPLPAPANLDALIQAERRVALRIAPVAALPRASIFLRDGVDDSARSRAEGVAFGGRSPDIIVTRDALAGGVTPTDAFKDLLDPRMSQRLKAGQVNRIFVRVHNRGVVDTVAEVELWAIPVDDDNQPDFDQTHWIQIVAFAAAPPSPLSIAVQAEKFAVTNAVEWTPPAGPISAFMLLALVRTQDGADPAPALTRLTAATFWNVLTRQADGENAAVRALRVEP